MRKAWWLVMLAACGDNQLPEQAITGQLWADTNGNLLRDPDEPALAGVLVYANIDGDPTINAGDPVTHSEADGSYRLVVPGPGTYQVTVKLPFGFRIGGMRKRSPIIGGHDAETGEYGFMVAVGEPFGGAFFQFCGGVLIDERHVVTAAHCSQGVGVADVGVLVGTVDPFGKGGTIFEVERIVLSPQFAGAENGHDISVWTLKHSVPLVDLGLTTVEMLHEDTATLAAPGTLATTIGWGVSDLDDSFLQQVHVPIFDADACAAVYSDSQGFDTQICAGVPEGGIDSCQGDSGGPLLVRDDARQVWMHAGITSYGNGCALPDNPGVYARVSALSSWAEEQAAETVSRAAALTATDLTATLDFAAIPTTRPQIGAIAERWQLTGLALPDQVAANVPIDVSWGIITDTPALDGFTCSLQPDRAAAGPIQNVACGLGTSNASVAGFPTGIFASELTVSRAGLTFKRRVNVTAGVPTTTTLSGTLSPSDGLDPDFSFDDFHLDYFDVSGLAGTKAFAIEASTDAFTMFLTLYDLDQRDFVAGGGRITATGPDELGKTRIVVVPDGRRYLIGVSSFEPNAIGAYDLSIINDGALVVH